MLANYFKRLYTRTMAESYGLAFREAQRVLASGGECLDCGADSGGVFRRLNADFGMEAHRYHGIEWNREAAAAGRENGLAIQEGDLNQTLPYESGRFRVVIALSVVEHLLHPCRFMREAHRVLEPGGTLIILTPNISTLFTAALILAGRMPSSGPHPDSDALIHDSTLFKVSREEFRPDTETETPSHRHLIVFSFSALRKYLELLRFTSTEGHGFGLYPFPNLMQKPLERLDPYHCHQMVFFAVK